VPRVDHFDGHTEFVIDELQVRPFTVPHDATEPCQFVFEHAGQRLGVLTDTGRMTPHIVESLDACDALLLECNHDADMLASGPYSASLKVRVGGPLGHLSNAQAGGLLAQLDCSRLQHLVAAHLSDKNNRPELAQAALADVLQCESDWIGIACQEDGLDWRTIA
jgi:phosphoribosyl 1,2-cyclic phosphodiesterase